MIEDYMPQITFSERELEDFLANDDNLFKYFDLRYIDRQVQTDAGIIDILAYNPERKMFVIIELKKDDLDFAAYGQVHRYHHAMNVKYNKNPHKKYKRFGKLIVGANLHKELHYLVKRYKDWRMNCSDTYYTLFGVKFDAPMTFNYFSVGQDLIESALIAEEDFAGYYA